MAKLIRGGVDDNSSLVPRPSPPPGFDRLLKRRDREMWVRNGSKFSSKIGFKIQQNQL